jgi:hypothetical protein
VLDVELSVPKAADRFDLEGQLTDADMRERLGETVGSLVEHAHTLISTA